MVTRSFLTAEWRNLLLFQYPVPDSVLTPYLPKGCELDRWNGSAHVSLVAFQFLKTKVFGCRWPGFSDFLEINLRFYLKHNGRRGVSFIREFVPSRLVAGIARYFYNEPYAYAKMSAETLTRRDEIQVEHRLETKSGRLKLAISASPDPISVSSETTEHFFKEHELGIGRDKSRTTLFYQVSHPIWRIHPVTRYEIEVDWTALYGKNFEFLSEAKPSSVILAEGSEVTVYRKSFGPHVASI